MYATKKKSSARSSLEDIAWTKTPSDYRSTFGGKRSVLVLGERGTTIKALSEMSEAELLKYIGKPQSHATVKQSSPRAAMTAEQFNALAERSTETLRVDDFEALLAAVRKLQPRTIVGVQGEYGGKKKIAEGRFIRLAETGPIAASWSRRAIVEEIVPGWRLEGAPRQLDVSPEQLRALPKTKFKRR
jgi:hypothetical protein